MTLNSVGMDAMFCKSMHYEVGNEVPVSYNEGLRG
jgi:hypothetical protein